MQPDESSTAATAPFSAPVAGGDVVGFVGGSGPEVLLLHGGPVSNYMEPLAEQLRGRYRVATYQQRGLEPSTLAEPYDVATHLADVIAVLDRLGWSRAFVAGHSWGGYLLLHVLAAHADRVRGALVVDPLGGVGDGGFAAFEAEMVRRTPPEDVARGTALDEKMMAGEATPEESLESLRIFWPAYFPSPEQAAPFPDLRVSAAMAGPTLASAVAELPTLEPRLQGLEVPTIFLHGAASPMPVTASTDTAEVIGSAAEVDVVPNAGHFVWMDVPDCVGTAHDRLAVRAAS
jgi:pimeloyl-ACP methyl ester carboxylesterase